MLERLLQIGADFNALDDDGRVKASLRYAATPEIPAVGEWVLLADADGNNCLARVEEVDGLSIVARADWLTWIPSQITHLSRVFASDVFVEHDRNPPTSPRGEHSGQLQPA